MRNSRTRAFANETSSFKSVNVVAASDGLGSGLGSGFGLGRKLAPPLVEILRYMERN